MNMPQNPGARAKSVLIIKLSALGDFMLALGAMAEVRNYHPDAHITLLTTPPYAEFALASPYFDAVENDGRPSGIVATLNLIKRIRDRRYDVIYDFQTSGRTAKYFQGLAVWSRRTPLWSGHAKNCAFPHTGEARKTMHSIDRLARQLEIAGLGPATGYQNAPPMPDMSWVQQVKYHNRPSDDVESFGLKRPYALLIPGASATRAAKIWPAKHYGEIARYLIDAKALSVGVLGARAEQLIAEEIAAYEPRILNLVRQTNLYQISNLAAHAKLVIGNDTGPMHLATLSGAPGIALFATDESCPSHAAPRGPAHIDIISAAKMHDIDTFSVITAIDSQLSDANND